MRYSVVPNTIDPMWGIDVDPQAAPGEHVRYVVDRSARLGQRHRYWRMLTGEDCSESLESAPAPTHQEAQSG